MRADAAVDGEASRLLFLTLSVVDRDGVEGDEMAGGKECVRVSVGRLESGRRC